MEKDNINLKKCNDKLKKELNKYKISENDSNMKLKEFRKDFE